MEHYSARGAERIYPTQRYGRLYLYQAICRCGFHCEAYGQDRTDNQLQGHIKTMDYLQSKDAEWQAKIDQFIKEIEKEYSDRDGLIVIIRKNWQALVSKHFGGKK